jgi:hypothetical protein
VSRHMSGGLSVILVSEASVTVTERLEAPSHSKPGRLAQLGHYKLPCILQAMLRLFS